MALGSVCVYCASSLGNEPAFAAVAQETGEALARAGIRLVYGGGSAGLMGALADAALAAGGEVTGVLPRRLFSREVAHLGLSEMIEVESMHARKQKMFELSDAFVALPGGLGTFEELLETTTWAQLGLHAKPIATLDVNGYWDPFHELLARAVARGLMKPASLGLVVRVGAVGELLGALEGYEPPTAERFVGLRESET